MFTHFSTAHVIVYIYYNHKQKHVSGQTNLSLHKTSDIHSHTHPHHHPNGILLFARHLPWFTQIGICCFQTSNDFYAYKIYRYSFYYNFFFAIYSGVLIFYYVAYKFYIHSCQFETIKSLFRLIKSSSFLWSTVFLMKPLFFLALSCFHL